ncbi:hypothetical protein ACFFU8_16795, partial [Chromobacterium piscinae]|uniref:hypothetical protein n=1 Tax=Chromobacterium piscinae TaxID=686831 RepID=UPI0035ECFBDD
ARETHPPKQPRPNPGGAAAFVGGCRGSVNSWTDCPSYAIAGDLHFCKNARQIFYAAHIIQNVE